MQPNIVHVTNQTRTLIQLPPVPGDGRWPSGVRLIPGLNRVPRAYLDAMAAYTAPVCDAGGRPIVTDVDVQSKDDKAKSITLREKQPVVRYPGRDSLSRLSERRVRLVGPRGASMGTQIVIHKDDEIDENAPEGPLPPEALPENEVHACKIVETVSDKEILTRWLREEQRSAVANVIRMRLAGEV